MDNEIIFRIAWKLAPKLPDPLLMGLADAASGIVWTLNGRSVRQMRQNYRYLLGRAPKERDVRRGVRSYFRCFAQQFALPGWSGEKLRQAAVYPRAGSAKEIIDSGPLVLALTHSGNWDLAGAWFCQECAPIVTVAEKLKPESLFEDFVRFRQSLGMTILGVGPGEHIFGHLVEATDGKGALVPLLADRDISGRGVEVRLGSSKALVAAGPAALALRLGRPLIAGHMHFETVNGKQQLQINLTDPIDMPKPVDGETEVEAWTRAWVRAIEPSLLEHFTDWHMMQKLFVADLDPERLARAKVRAGEETEDR
jgi:Lauroyl/myristoyl acyltransferase